MNKSKTKFTRPRFANNVRRRLDMDAVDDKILKSNIQKHNAAGDGPNSIEEASVKFLATKVCTESKESGDMAKFLMNFNELTIQDADSDNLDSLLFSERVATEEDVEAGKLDSLTNEMMNNPEALAMVQSRLSGMVGNLSGYYESLPKAVKRRVKALKKLQLESLHIEAKFQAEIHELECKYAKQLEPLYQKRNEIINAKVEPTDEECDFPSDDEHNESKDSRPKIDYPIAQNKETSKEEHGMTEDTKGIPEFWLTIFKNVEIIADNIQEHDEPILAHLTDVKVILHDKPMGFTLEFHFSPNDFFTNTVLTKYYELRCTVDEKDPFSFEGAEIVKCKGCEINWNKGKNVTVKTIIKKQKHKSKGSVRTVPKTVPNDSFFNFFAPPDVPENEDEIDDETQALLAADFEIGEIIRQRLIPRAVLYFTGEALVDEEYDDEEEDEDEESEEESDDEEDEDNPAERKVKRSSKAAGGNIQSQECKQQ
ncbi:nucleosome assembly protein 1-like 1-B [Dinothrombium tinctorium]|uniref:Nucleosome assembly protein 1-like 1-B n=1 Tax=Dinothrombium tinctorium TaxID=1965070 RepID=A0A3S3QFM2_9ACAR|nr:nucleosome assembly protein 1-like 1-B [Dinothrombium tinctorium]